MDFAASQTLILFPTLCFDRSSPTTSIQRLGPTEALAFSSTNNFRARSFNFLLGREETRFTGPNVVIRNTPAFRFKLMGQRLFQTPFYLDLDTSAEGLSRADRLIETPGNYPETRPVSQILLLHSSLPGPALKPLSGLS